MHLPPSRKILVAVCVLLIILPALLREALADSDSVTLIRFTAAPGSGRIGIEWETATELDVVGFCVQRSVQANTNYTRMPGCVAANGNALIGAAYSLTDTAVEAGTRYYYQLEVINNNAAVELYGPVSAMAADPPRHVWHVATTGSDLTGTGSEAEPFATIQHGVAIAANGDTVLVHPGVYTENINFNGKNIVVSSEFLTTGDEDAILRTVIDGARKGHTVTFALGETTAAQLNGFTITNGYARGEAAPDSHGGGVFCSDNAAPTLTHLRVTGNEAADEGGGMYFAHCTPILRDISVTNNRAGQGGGGIRYSYGSVDMENVVISHNWAGTGGAGVFLYHADGYISNALIADNTGGGKGSGVMLDGSSPKFTHVTIAGNLTTGHGGGLNVSYMSDPTLVNSIVWGNTPEQIYYDTDWPGEAISIEYSDIEGGQAGIVTNGQGPVYWGAGNLDRSPRFVHPGLGNYRLADNSPALGAGKIQGAPNSDLEGNPRPSPTGTNPDMGAHENPHRHAAVVKLTYLSLILRSSAPVAPPLFWADSYQITEGQCTFLHWSVTNVQEVYLNGMPVVGQGSIQVCPSTTTTYALRAIDMSGQVVDHQLIITVVPDAPEVIFIADRTRLAPGECTTLRWSVTNVQAVYLNGQGVPGKGSAEVCPSTTTHYILRVVYPDGVTIEYVVTIAVESEASWVGIDAAGNFYRGNPGAAVKLEEFMDFQCPFCARHALQTGPLIQQAYIDTGQVRQVFRNYPLDIHANALPAARAAYCAGQQSPALFWAMYDWLFANQASWREAPDAADRLMKAAVAAGADDTQYAACITDPTTDAHIQHDIQEGEARGVRGTPTFYINSCAITGAVPYQVFQDNIKKVQQGECLGYPTPAPPIPTPISTVAPEPTKAPAPTATPVPVVDRPVLTNGP